MSDTKSITKSKVNNTLDAALQLAGRGIPVFPCNYRKEPLTEHGFKEATTDPATLSEWWSDVPDAFIGMPTGSRTNVTVFDVDPARYPFSMPRHYLEAGRGTVREGDDERLQHENVW